MRLLLTGLLFLVLAAPAAAADGFMSVQDFQFAPDSVRIEPGEKVSFNFEGPTAHSATLSSGQIDRYDSGITGPGFTKEKRFGHRGRFTLFCRPHPDMRASVQVGEAETVKPRLSSVRARPGRRRVTLRFRLSERSVVTVTVGRKRVRAALSPGRRSLTVRGLRRGRRRASLSARDGWGNRSPTARRSFRVR
jgi:plastocyanin